MATQSNKLDRLRIATPCPIEWDQMQGDNRVRFCSHCRLNVYDISELSRFEAESLIATTEGRLCARLYRRADGTILTKDCPVGLRALRRRVAKRTAAIFAAIVSLSAAAFSQQSSVKDEKTSCTPQTRITRADATQEYAENGLSGTVSDPMGASVPGAKITITNAESNEIKTTSTNDAGRFEFTPLVPGSYSIAIEGTGFKAYQITNVIVEKGKLINLDTILETTDQHVIGIVSVAFVEIPRPGTTIISGDRIRKLPF